MRGFNNTASTDHKFIFRKELWLYPPAGISSSTSQAYFDWLDTRKDYVLGMNATGFSLGKAQVDADGGITALSGLTGPTDWNLGTPSSTNNANCISKTVYVKPDGKTFDIISEASPKTPLPNPNPTSVSKTFSPGSTITGVDGVQLVAPSTWASKDSSPVTVTIERVSPQALPVPVEENFPGRFASSFYRITSNRMVGAANPLSFAFL